MENDSPFTNGKLENNYGWLKLVITGKDATGMTTGKVEFYLADFRNTATPKGIVKVWTKVDLTSLGKVHRLEFSFEGSDVGEWGLNTPAYCCIDDIRIVVR